MNERIKELSEQAGVEHTQNCGVEQYYFEQDELEKFAELIVRECSRVAFDTHHHDPENIKSIHISNAIVNHFGM